MTIRVSDQRLLAPLMEALRIAGCSAARVADDCCRVAAPDDAQAYLELRFFARAWAIGRGAEVHVEA